MVCCESPEAKAGTRVTVICAATITAPPGSLTLPETVANCVCENARPPENRIPKAAANEKNLERIRRRDREAIGTATSSCLSFKGLSDFRGHDHEIPGEKRMRASSPDSRGR